MYTTLQASQYQPPSAPLRRMGPTRMTVIEDQAQVSVRQAPRLPTTMKARQNITSPMTEDFPTPRAMPAHYQTSYAASSPSDSSDSESEHSDGAWSKGSSQSDFDELYDLSPSGSEAEEFPLKLSRSIKERIGKKQGVDRFPSIVIPSPSHWPTIEKMRATTALSPSFQMQLSPAVLARLDANKVPSRSSAPSLDGSITSAEMTSSESCPSTPDLSARDAGEEWDLPLQLDPASIDILKQISGDDHHDQVDAVIEVPEPSMEMRESANASRLTFTLDTQPLKTADYLDIDDPLSALSVPSPGGFFASLDSTVARNTWSGSHGESKEPNTSIATEFYGVPFRASMSDALPTSTATSFYNLPWQSQSGDAVEQVVTVPGPISPTAPVTARRLGFPGIETIEEVDEIDENYQDSLASNAASNIDRTKLWLSSQTDYMQALCEEDEITNDFAHVEGAMPESTDSPISMSSPESAVSPPSKKAANFTPATSNADASLAKQKRISPIHDGTFWQGWQYMKRSQRARDVFQHRQVRAEAEQIKRVSLQKQHARQLSGRFDIPALANAIAAKDTSIFTPEPADEASAVIVQAHREQQALSQMQSSSWAVAAQREVSGGGRLLTSPIADASFRARPGARILDLAGQVRCSWAWTVAAEYPRARVWTTVPSDLEAHVAESAGEGPANHAVVAAPRLWELPFADAYFDVVSARNLHAVLRTVWPRGEAVDEWDLTLRECLRVLKPGGYLEFDLLDAELAHATPRAEALGVEFAYNLKTRGYDPVAGKSFLPRLKRAGFQDIKRAWLVLPVADAGAGLSEPGEGVEKRIGADGTVEEVVTGSTRDVRAMTGLVGARMWEQWMLKLNGEMGRSETRCLDQVAKALEEGGKSDASWRCLVGWAKKI